MLEAPRKPFTFRFCLRPFEAQFDLPAGLIDVSDGAGGEHEQRLIQLLRLRRIDPG